MAEVILIHGIAQEQRQADDLEALWLPALAGGVRAAGQPDLADRLWRRGPPPGGIEVRMAAYGDLFLPPDSQGDDDDLSDLTPDQQALAATLAEEWLARAATRNGHPDQPTATTQLAYLDTNHEDQGLREEVARAVLNGAARMKWFAPLGMAYAQRFVNKSLRQVTGYLTDPALRDQIQQRVLAHLDADTRVIIGHSLGSVIAYEIAAGHLNRRLVLLLTLGSPLGLRTIVYERLRPQPPVYPKQVARWVNIADHNDLVAAQPDLAPLFGASKPDNASLDCSWTVDNGAKPHEASFYLTKGQVGRPIAEALL
jgi:hypothetical protein